MTVIGAGWRVHHKTERTIELRKEDATYRIITGRDGYVRVRVEPGVPQDFMVNTAIAYAQMNDAKLAVMVAQQIVPKRLGGYQMEQKRLAFPAFGTPEDPEVIGVKRA
jgi:hypothetical protein